MTKIDTNKRWVRVLNKTENGFIVFEFFVTDADLYVELILPEAAYQEFCITNHVTFIEDESDKAAIPNDTKNLQQTGLLKVVK